MVTKAKTHWTSPCERKGRDSERSGLVSSRLWATTEKATRPQKSIGR